MITRIGRFILNIAHAIQYAWRVARIDRGPLYAHTLDLAFGNGHAVMIEFNRGVPKRLIALSANKHGHYRPIREIEAPSASQCVELTARLAQL